jgi:CubicO group peptidase (beta-lactamase class C family)
MIRVGHDAGMSDAFDAGRLDRLRAFLAAEVDTGRLPGVVVAVARGDEVAVHEAFGYRDAAAGEPMTTDTLFWIASMTKPVTTAGALLLHEQGRLVLDAPVGEYLPELAGRRVWDRDADAAPGAPLPTRPARRQPMVLDLLRHTAGMPEGMLGDTPVHGRYEAALGDGMTDLAADAYVERLAALPLLHDPGAEWHYGWGLDLAGIAIERITGEALGGYLTRAVLGPLGMTDTTFGVPDGARARYAATDVPLPAGGTWTLPDLGRARFHAGGAGLVATAGDYLRFARMLARGGATPDGRLLGRKTAELMCTDRLEPGTDVTDLWRPGWNPGYRFGLGLAVRGVAGTTGPGTPGEVTWPGAAGTFWWADPHEDLAVVVLAHHALGSRLESQVRAVVLGALA